MTPAPRPERRVLLVKLSERTSQKGSTWLSGWLGAARLVGFRAKEPDKFGNPVFDVYAVEPREQPAAPEPRPDPVVYSSERAREREVARLAAQFDREAPADADENPF